MQSILDPQTRPKKASPSKPRLKRGFDTKDAADYIGRSYSYLTHARSDGVCVEDVQPPPFIKVGRSVIYLIEDLDAWLDQFKKYRNSTESCQDS